MSATPWSSRHTLCYPLILPIVRTDHQNQVISRRIIKVEEIRYEVKQPEAAGQNDQLILRA